MDGNFLAENLDKIKETLDKVNEHEFVQKTLLLFSDEFKENNEIEKLLRDFYKKIKDVIFCVIENKASMEKLCQASNQYDFNEDSVNGEVNYLIVMYIYLMRFLIEYTYRNHDSFYIERMIYAIDDFHSFDFVYKNIDIYGIQSNYIYAKNLYLAKLFRQDIKNVDLKINNFKLKSDKIDLAISKSEEISNKYDELKNIDGDYFELFKSRLAEISQDLESGILAKVKIIEDLDERVNNANDNLTLKGLSEAYSRLGIEKNNEKNRASKVLMCSMGIVFTPLIIRMLTLFFGVDYSIYDYMLTGTATLIFIYYFRVALINYNSIKTELNQINLRTTLCKFIQGYVEFSQRNNNHESLSKFERLIFSNIIPDDKNIPATLDGMEQLAKLIEALKIK